MIDDGSRLTGRKPFVSIGSRGESSLEVRLAHALDRMVSGIDEAFAQKLQAVDDVEALALLVLKGLSSRPLITDRRLRLAIKGAQRFRMLVENAGGTLSAADVVLRMKKTADTIYKMIRRNELLAFKQKGSWAFPVGQFDPSTLKPIPHLGDLLESFTPDVDRDSRVIFCLRDFEGTGKSPLTLLAEGFPVGVLRSSAATFFEHNAR